MRPALACGLLLAVAAIGVGRAQADPAELGARIYRDGATPSGLRAELPGGISLPPGQGACMGCHRASGMGAIEGRTLAPPVTGEALYNPGSASTQAFGPDFARRARRPAYSDATLAQAIRAGVDPNGRSLAAPMPRYNLDDAEMAALIGHLKSLSDTAAPGVDEREIHFATVVTEGVAEAQRRALLEVLDNFFRDRNAGSASESRRAAPGVWPIKARRQWRLHVWTLTGPAEDWPRQLQAYYDSQPVFALVGGLAAGPWQPVHDFCEAGRLPCLYPSTDLPGTGDGFYSVYLSRGMALEAETWAEQRLKGQARGPVLQVVDGSVRSAAAAAALDAALRQRGLAVPETVQLGPDADAAAWRRLLDGRRDVDLVLWSGQALAPLREWGGALARVTVSATLQGGWPAVPPELAGKTAVIHPYALPERKDRQLARLHAWLAGKGIAAGDERIQADAYFAAAATLHGLMGIGGRYSREYFIEQIEDMHDNAAPSSIYPRVSFGPGQRHASKGAFLLSLDADSKPIGGGWIRP